MDTILEQAPVLGNRLYTSMKNRRKLIRVVIELLILAALIYLIVNAFFTLTDYAPYDPKTTPMCTEDAPDTGFVALSYTGVDRTGKTSYLIGQPELRAHMQALKDQGYVTITQEDVLRYYKEGAMLPKRSLLLLFEDGRRDSAIFAQKILEEMNYKATMLSYAINFGRNDLTFLHLDDVKEMLATSYWEMGTNGYRTSFINVFDRYGNYLGELDPLRFSMIRSGLGRRYNHYLMDFIRDKHGVPKESLNRMRSRIGYDYERLRDVYNDILGYVPGMHILLHGNTGQFGNNAKVSAVNEQWIRATFKMNFNREGYSFNQRNCSLYDLTRMQPQPDWSCNHLLMRIKYDINQPITFELGDVKKQKAWMLLEGASEVRGEEFILTSLPQWRGLARLNGSDQFGADVRVSVAMRGNKFAEQTIYLRANEDLTRYLAVSLLDGYVVVHEDLGDGAGDVTRFKRPLYELLGGVMPSVEEDRREVEANNLETFARYAPSPEQAKEYLARATKRRQEPAKSVAEGGEPAKKITDINVRSRQEFEITLKGDTVSIMLDSEHPVEPVTVQSAGPGYIYLCSGWADDAWSQRNLADDVYDGKFYKFRVADVKDDKLLYTLEDTGAAWATRRLGELWELLLSGFVRNVN